jgi:hypothetical protein
MDRIRSKLGAIRAGGGFDAPALPDPADPQLPAVIRRLRDGDPKLLQDLETEADDGFDIEERARRAAVAGRAGAGAREVPETATSAALFDTPSDTRADTGGPAPAGSAGCRAPERNPPPVLAWLGRPAGEASGWLVVTSDGVVERFVLVRQGRPVEDRETALRLLTAAATGTAPAATGVPNSFGPEAAGVLDVVARQLVPQLGPLLSGPGSASLAARLLLRRLAAVPGGPSREACARTDAVMDRLRAGLPAGSEATLEALVRCEAASPGPLEDLLDRVERLVEGTVTAQGPDRGCGRGGARASARRRRQRLVGLFRLEPGTELVLEPGPR